MILPEHLLLQCRLFLFFFLEERKETQTVEIYKKSLLVGFDIDGRVQVSRME